MSALGWCGISGLPDRVFGLYMLSGDLISSLMLHGGMCKLAPSKLVEYNDGNIIREFYLMTSMAHFS